MDHRVKQLLWAALAATALLIAVSGHAQDITPEGIGLSRQATVRDTLVADGDSVFLIVSFQAESGWTVAGLGMSAQEFHQLRLHAYATTAPAGTPLQTFTVTVNPGTVEIDTLADPPTLRSYFPLPLIVTPRIKSLQVELALWARNAEGDVVFSDPYTSRAAVSGALPLNNPVDTLHATYLRFEDTRTYPPVILSPAANSVIPRIFSVMYSQPEEAAPGSLTLSFLNTQSQNLTTLYLRNVNPGAQKTVLLDATSLINLLYIDSLSGATALAHGEPYRITLTYRDINGNLPASSVVDHVRVDRLTERPVLLSPTANQTLPRRFDVRFIQPEQAAAGSLTLTFVNQASGTESPHVLYVSDRQASSEKLITLDGLGLFDPMTMDSLTGGDSLQHQAAYRLIVSYRDTLSNPAASDSMSSLLTVLRTPPPTLYEPRAGTSRSDSTFPLTYRLDVHADTVWLVFEADTASAVVDSLSPHILRLIPEVARGGLHDYSIDGTALDRSVYVAESNHGSNDRLKAQTIYTVRLVVGDTLGNDNVFTENYGYVWPNDLATLPPVLMEPRSGQRIGETFPVAFRILETVRPGSVYIRLQTLQSNADPGSPHRVYLRDIPPGVTRVTLNGLGLHFSELTDSVTGPGTPEQNRTLVHNVQYIVRVFYQDSLGNAEAGTVGAFARYDIRTEPVVISTPQAGDTLPRVNLPVRFRQDEPSLPGKLRITFAQSGGYETDPGSPHSLYLTNTDADTGKLVIVEPSALYASSGIDSATGGSELLPRAIYRLTIDYQDTLANAGAATTVDNLVYGSGAVVRAAGDAVSSGIIVPGEPRLFAFWLGLRTDGGTSVLRALRFTTLGDAQASDLTLSETSLWQSVDTQFVETEDARINSLDRFADGELTFDSLALNLTPEETFLLVTLAFPSTANPNHRLGLQLAGPSAVDCGTDPVLATSWPMGAEDVALDVQLTSFATEQDTLFGALRVWWIVASESDNAGFILSRRAAGEDDFQDIASYATSADLVGRGTNPSASRYQYIDQGLTPGATYFYALRAVSFSFHEQIFDAIAEGTPRLPPNDFILGEAYPNPFNQDVTFRYVVPYTAEVKIIIYDVLGRQQRRLVHRVLAPAEYLVRWDSRDDYGQTLPSGVYFYRMEAGGRFEQTHKLVLVR
ncbi:MAG: T9SS type A sorting domain-containing protein [bacterium]|nr:T9SS type A sorting domain-containing protein [bacterium]